MSRTGAAPDTVDRLDDAAVALALRAARTRVAVLVVLEVARLSRKYGNATPSRRGMAERFRCCERTVTRAVRALEDGDWLTVVRDPPMRRRDGTYTRRRTSLYRLHRPRNTRSHRRDTPVTSKAPYGAAIAPAPAHVPVDNHAHGPPRPPLAVGRLAPPTPPAARPPGMTLFDWVRTL